MVAIYRYENGLKFTGKIASSEKKAWEYLDKVYGQEICGVWCGCNKEAFVIKKVEII